MTILIKKISIEPKCMDNKIISSILTKLKTQVENDCSKENGYILSINKIIKILEVNISSANSDIICTVKFDANILKPEIGKILQGKVCMVFDKGIFIDVHNKLKVLVPESSISKLGYSFNIPKNIFVKDDKDHIKIDDILTVKITGLKYSKKNFSCFADLIIL
jgi:DNA-directed RNA polymerase subunit E'/Rpb7